MSGLVAIFGKKSEAADMEPLIERVKFRGTCKGLQTDEEGCGIAIMSSSASDNESDASAALDGYMVFSEEEGMVLQGGEGETRFCDLFDQEGLSCFESIEGEFAIAYFNEGGSHLVARDPFGVKPLYYAKKDNTLYIAPEIKALVELDVTIKEAPPGSYLDQINGWVKYYQVPRIIENKNLTLEEAEEKMRHLLYLAVEERVKGVDNLGVYLSGGLDSSVVAALASEISPDPISTYTVGVSGSQDIEYAKIVAERIDAMPHVYEYDLDEMLKVLPKVIYHLESFDCAYVRSSIPNYIAARQAALDGREVMLTGEGSDEIFAGYSYLKTLGSEQEITDEIEGFLKNLSKTGLQRVDRMNSAHGLDCRVPFLKPALLELVQQFPLDWKLHGRDEDEPVDKWILRRAFVQELGSRVAWREKQQFDQGSGSSDMLSAVAEEAISDNEFARESELSPVPVRNKEELYYYRIFRDYFPESVLPLVGRWTKTS
ncbi:MAG: asparagine synthase-related protein [Bacillota bacterium]